LAGPEAPLLVGDVDLENTPVPGCIQVHGLRLAGALLMVDGRIHIRSVDTSETRGIFAFDEARVLDSIVDVDAGQNTSVGITSAASGLLARSRVRAAGDEPIAVSGNLDIVDALLQVDAVTPDQIIFGAVGIAGEGVMAHNRIEVVGAPGARVVGIASTSGILIANDILVAGTDAVGIRLEDFIPPTAALHHNRLDIEGDGCRLAIGRVGDVCLDLAACGPCSASVGNTEAPASPPALSAIALGAPTTVSVDLDGACRGATSGVGARVTAP
jgi:hypothetical protein